MAILEDKSFTILFGNGTDFQRSQKYRLNLEEVIQQRSGITIGDANLDGMLDFAIADLVGGFAMVLSRGDGTYSDQLLSMFSLPESLAVSDFNLDSRPDLIVYEDNGGMYVLPGQVDGTFAKLSR